MEERASLSEIFVKEEKGAIKKEDDIAQANFGHCPLWKGNILLQQGKTNLRVAVNIFHQEDSKNTLQLFDWTQGTKPNDEITINNKNFIFRWVVGYNPKTPNGSSRGEIQTEHEKLKTIH